MKRSLTAWSLLLCLISPATHADTPPKRTTPLVFAMPESSYASMQGRWVEAIYREVFEDLGLRIKIVPLPTKRASKLIEQGQFDGEVHRSIAYAKDHPDLVRVTVPHFAASFCAYGRQAQLRLERGWNSFNASPLRVDHLLGSVTSGKELSRRIPADRLSELTTIEQGLMKLEAGRTDILVALDLTVDPMLQLPRFRKAGIVKLGVLETVEGYLYLQKRHADMLPAVTQTLARLQREGRIDKLGQQAVRDWKERQH